MTNGKKKAAEVFFPVVTESKKEIFSVKSSLDSRPGKEDKIRVSVMTERTDLCPYVEAAVRAARKSEADQRWSSADVFITFESEEFGDRSYGLALVAADRFCRYGAKLSGQTVYATGFIGLGDSSGTIEPLGSRSLTNKIEVIGRNAKSGDLFLYPAGDEDASVQQALKSLHGKNIHSRAVRHVSELADLCNTPPDSRPFVSVWDLLRHLAKRYGYAILAAVVAAAVLSALSLILASSQPSLHAGGTPVPPALTTPAPTPVPPALTTPAPTPVPPALTTPAPLPNEPPPKSSGASVTASAPCPYCPPEVKLRGGRVAMMMHEVTVGDFRHFISSRGAALPPLTSGGCWTDYGQINQSADWSHPGFVQTDTHPVVCVSPDDAIAYANWLSAQTGGRLRYRLPTSTEWALAAGDDGVFGADASRLRRSRCLSCGGTGTGTVPVGSFGVGKAGFADLLGNVAEWTVPCRDGEDCSGFYSQGKSWGHVIKEGESEMNLRSEKTFGGRNNATGFRLVRDIGD